LINRYARGQFGKYHIERGLLDPANAEHLGTYGLNCIGSALKMASRGLQQIPAGQIRDFAHLQVQRATGSAFYANNSESDSLYGTGHVYLYRSPLLAISEKSVAFIAEAPNNSMRLCIRAFCNGALELPPGTIARTRERVKGGAKDGDLFRELRSDTTIKAYQQTRWADQEPVVGDVMLGLGSIVLNTRQERHTLEDNRYLVDMINPATREFHNLDGSTMWLRIVDTAANKLLFVVIGTGKHRYAVMDALNNFGAATIWQYQAHIQQCLYEDVPSTTDEITAHIARALQKCDPITAELHKTLAGMDTDRSGAFFRGLRRGYAFENGDSYLST